MNTDKRGGASGDIGKIQKNGTESLGESKPSAFDIPCSVFDIQAWAS